MNTTRQAGIRGHQSPALFVSVVIVLAFGAENRCVSDDGAKRSTVDAGTLHKKVLCGYQGWFRCPGDGTDEGWLHWSRQKNRLTADSVTVEMWPDMSEYSDGEKYVVPGFQTPNGHPATLFSSANRGTVERHFLWMQQHGIDGVFIQRFLVNLGRPSFDTVLDNVRSSAKKTGRVYAVCYDLTGASNSRLHDLLVNDWKRLVDEKKVTQDAQYLHHNGKPVLFVWGFFEDRFDAALAHRIIDSFRSDGDYGVTLIGGSQWWWRTGKSEQWAEAFRRFDVISPWNVGNYSIADGKKVATTSYWQADLAEAERHGMEYMPVIYPGFGWTNLKGKDARRVSIQRRGGEFLWEQFVAASDLGIRMSYVAMFDEVDEATAIFKVSDLPPTQANFETYEGLPSDWYLRLTGEGAKVIRGEQKAVPTLPIQFKAVQTHSRDALILPPPHTA